MVKTHCVCTIRTPPQLPSQVVAGLLLPKNCVKAPVKSDALELYSRYWKSLVHPLVGKNNIN